MPTFISLLSLVLAIAVAELLLFAPALGLKIFWGLLIPIAPLLLFFAPAVWRQICPLGSIALLPRELGLVSVSATVATAGERRIFRWAGFLMLFILPPLRPLLFDRSEAGTFLILILFAILSFFLGTQFIGRGAFCSGICPVHFIEVIYGQLSRTLRFQPRCGTCDGCAKSCVDVHEGRAFDRSQSDGQDIYRVTAWGLPGFVLGWFLIPADLSSAVLWKIYGPTLGGALLSFGIFWNLDRMLGPNHRSWLVRAAAVVALLAYYWFQIPRLLCSWGGYFCSG